MNLSEAIKIAESSPAIEDEAIRLLIEHAKCSIPIKLDEESAEYFRAEAPFHIRYWGSISDDWSSVETVDHETYAIPEDWIMRGLGVLSLRGYYRLSELLRGEYDCESLDCLFQAGVIGDIVYG